MRAAVETLFREGQMLSWGLPATHVLVETLLVGGDEGDLVEAEAATARIAAVPTDGVEPARDMWLLRLRAMLSGARGDAEAYEHFGDRYRDLAKAYEFDGHIGWAEALK